MSDDKSADDIFPPYITDLKFGNERFTSSPTGGLKDMSGDKARLGLVPPSLNEAVAKVLWWAHTDPEKAYPLNNWRKGLEWSKPLESIERHAAAIRDGQWLDPESGLPHAYHIATNVAFLIEFIDTHPDLDDLSRPNYKTRKGEDVNE